jgi:hypothetical protein
MEGNKMLEHLNKNENDINPEYKYDSTVEKDHTNKTGQIAPIAAISIITLIGLVCVVIDYYLQKE